MQTTVDFLRHGEVVGGSYYRGITNDPLTELGWQQMKKAVVRQNWNHIISSPLNRCLDFAQHLSAQTSIPFSIEPNWQEISFGDWEGKTAKQINHDDLMSFYQDPINNTAKNGENFSDFQSRINQVMKNLIKQYNGQHVLVITHAGVIRSLFSLFLKLPASNIFNIQVDHGSLTRFQCVHDKHNDFIKLVFHNLRI